MSAIQEIQTFLTAHPDSAKILAGAFLLLALILIIRKRRRRRFDPRDVYEPRPLFSEHERRAYFQLRRIAARLNLELFAKVRLLDIVEPRDPRDYSLINRVIRKHCDFVLLLPSGETLAVVELDDSSHNGRDAAYRDMVKDRALADAGIPVLRCTQVTQDLETQLARLVRRVS